MNNYYQVDRKGNPVEIYALYEGDVVPEDFKLLWENPQRFFKPMWDFKRNAWVEDEDLTEKINLAKQAKREELSLSCQEHILNGFDYKINNIEYRFSYDREAQLNMQETFQMFQNDMLKTIIWTVKLNGEHMRLTLDRPLFNLIYTASLQHKQDAISRFRDKLMLILKQAETLEAVNAINWNVLVVEPSPEPVVFNSNNTVNKQIDDVKVAQAQGNIELLQIIFGMGGMF